MLKFSTKPKVKKKKPVSPIEHEAVKQACDIHCEWNFAYVHAINELCHEGVITVEQKDLILERSRENFNKQTNLLTK